MTSLEEVYGGVGATSLRRFYLGTGLFVLGACMVVAGIVVATTGVLAPLGVGVLGSRELAGVLAGLGAPAVFVGIFTVLPASPRERAAAAIGASLAVFGVVLFWHAYPERWAGGTPDLAFPVAVVYFLGAITTFWSMFAAIVSFKIRNDPGGTVTLERTVAGETTHVEVPVSELEGKTVSGLGGVGVLGDVDRDSVMREPDGATGAPASDGGTQAERPRTPDEGVEIVSEPVPDDPGDRYCGNCTAFEYVRTGQGIQPYCGFHDEVMDDMEPCERWRPNAPR